MPAGDERPETGQGETMTVKEAVRSSSREGRLWMPLSWLALPPAELKVALTLLSYADAEGCCWPRYGLIATAVGMHRRTVMRLVGRLETELGLLRREERVGSSGARSSNRFWLNRNWTPSDNPTRSRRGWSSCHGGVTALSPGGDPAVTGWWPSDHPELDPMNLDPENSLSPEDRCAVEEREAPSASDPNRNAEPIAAEVLTDPVTGGPGTESVDPPFGQSASNRAVLRRCVQPVGPSGSGRTETPPAVGPEERTEPRRRGALPTAAEALPWEGTDGQLNRSFVEYVIRALPKKADVAESWAMARAFLRRARQDAERLLAVEDLWEDYRRPSQPPSDPHAQQLAAIAAALTSPSL